MKNNLILTMKAEKELSAIGGEQTLFIQPTYHPLITHLSPTFGSHLDAIRKYAAMVALMLLIGVGNMWGASIFNCGIDVNGTWYKGTGTINSGNWLGNQTAFNSANLGVLTSLELGGQYDTWDNNQTDYCSWNTNNGIWITIYKNGTQKTNFKLSCFHDSFSSNNNTWKTSGTIGGCSDSGSWGTYTLNISAYTPGNDYTIKASWTSPSGQSTNATASFTIPGFTSLSTTSVTFDNTTVGDNNSKSITYTHYGTAPTNVSDRYSITGTNADQFSITALSGTEATIKFTPTSAGTKTATLVINDVHGKTTGSITLSGTGTAPTVPTIILSSATPSALVSGNDITLVGTRANSSNTISFQYTTNDGSTWNDITPKTSSLSSNTLTVTWTVPEAHGATQTYKFRAKLAEATPIYSSKSSAVSVYGKKTIHVKNREGWENMYLYAGDDNTGAWPGTTSTGSNGFSISREGSSQWYTVVITSANDIFILNKGEGGAGNQTGNMNYSNYFDGNYYECYNHSGSTVDGQADGQLYNSSAPTVPTVTTLDATVSSSTSATFSATVTNYGNDKTTYGVAYYQYATVPAAATIYSSGTKSQISNNVTANNTSGNTGAKTITAGVNYWYVAYAFNGQSSGAVQYGDVKCLRTTAVTLAPGSGTKTTGTTSVLAIGGRTISSITAPTKTGYNFAGYYTGSGGTGTKYYNANGTAAVANWPTGLGTTLTLTAHWTPKTTTVTLDINTGTGSNQTVSATYDDAMPLITTSSAAIAVPSKTGYTLLGYWDATSAGKQYYSYGGTPTPSLSSANNWDKEDATKTLYARWQANNYTLTLYKNDGGDTYTTQDATYDAGITITPPTREGYTFTGYWTKASGAGTKIIDTDNHFVASVTDYTGTGKIWKRTSNTNLYARWTPNTYDVILDVNGATTGSNQTVTATFDADMPTTQKGGSTPISAPSKTGYTFGGYWTNAAGTGTQYYTSGLASNHVWDVATDNTNIYAKWTPNNYTVTLDIEEANYGTIAGKATSASVTFDAAPTAIAAGQLPTAAQGYAFMGFFTAAGGEGVQVINANGTWIASVTGYTDASGNWIHADNVLLYAYYKKAEITALTLDNAVVAPSETVGVTPTVAPTPTGTNSICWKLLYSNGNLYSPQPTFSPASPAGITNKVTFTAPGTSGTYLVVAVLRTGNDCNGGTKLDSVAYPFQVAGDHNVTIQYKDAEGNTLQASGTVNGRPLVWSDDITAPDIFGYTFARWDAGDGVTIKNGDSDPVTTSTDVTIKIKAVYDGRLTAVYTQKQMIYFKNTLGWSSVYVNFHTGDYWNEANGSGNNGVTNRNKAMTQIDDTDIWYYDYGTAGITPTRYVSFTEDEQEDGGHGYENFYKADGGENVVYPARRADDLADKAGAIGFYAATPMFVPLAGQTPVIKNSNHANYFNSGYWTKYTSGTGYTLEVYYDSDSSEKIKDIVFSSADELMPLAAVANLEASTTYRFRIKRAGDVYYGNAGTMTYADHGQSVAWEMSNEATRRNDSNTADVFAKCKITTTAAGDYTFNLSYSGDNSNPVQYRLRMEVDYPIADGDYRVIYKDNERTAFKPSAIVTKANNHKDTVSFFIRPKSSPVMKIQKSSVNPSSGAITWTDHITITSEITDARCPKDSVYNICLTMNESGDISVENVEGYTGSFYIRTDAANSRWDNYRAADHLMTYSEYSKTYSDYTHYFMAYVAKDKNVKFVVANDYSPCISDTLVQSTFRGGDSYHVNASGNIQADANVRFMWNRSNNAVYRAYLAKAQSDGSKFLVLRANSSTDLMDENGNPLTTASGNNHGAPDNSIQFTDNQNWIYEANVKVKPGAFVKLYAHFHDKNFYYRGNDNGTFDDTKVDGVPNAINLITGSGDAVKVRVVYDFKTDRLLAAWMPEGEIDESKVINADVMFIREHQGDISQLTFTKSGEITAIKTAYGVMRFNKWTLNNKEKTGSHTVLSSPASVYERSLFWISFPFRVKLNDIFGFGTYGVDWAIQRYDGAERAEKGFWLESSGFWKWMDRNTEYLQPNQGYLLAIDLDLLGESASVWNNGVENVELYFPSYGTMPSITSAAVLQTLPDHACTIDRSGESDGHGGTLGSAYNRTVIDSHWNVMSVPTYVNTSNVSFSNTDWITEAADGKHGPNFLYTWNASDNTLTPTPGAGYHYHAMHAYMVQYHGNVTWSASSGSPYSSIVARRTYAEQPKKVNFCLEIQQNDKMLDRTYVVLSNDEETKTEFSFGEDMGKEFNTRNANIYTVVEGYIPTAGNTLPMSEQTTVVPVGIKVNKAGEYTFAMPEGTNRTGVVLVDTENGTRTNLALGDYTVTLGAGTTDGRFVLEISPVANTPTGIDEVPSDQVPSTNVRKVMVDGVLYIVKDGKAYDARGTRVK